MPLGMQEKYIDVTNTTGLAKTLFDKWLPNGRLEFNPGETKPVPAQTWYAKFRTSWLRRASQLQAQATETEPELELDQDPEVEEIVLTMAEIRASAKERGLSIPVGMTKAQALELLSAEGAGE